MKEDEDDQAAKISSAPVRNVSREEFHEQEYEKSMPETPRNDVHGLHADSHRRDVDELLGQIEALREHLGQMREHVSRIYEMDDLEAADENKYRERIEVTRNVMKDMDALLDKEIGWMNRGHTAQKEVKGEAVEEQPPQCPVVTPPASLTSHQHELPLNMAPPAQRTRDMHPTLRVDGTAGNCIRVTWTVAANQLRTKNKAFTSPAFELWQGGAFVPILSSYPHNMKGGFQASKGVGRVELKFCGETEFARKIHYQVAIGRNKEFHGLDHDFGTRPQSTLQHEWNFLNAINKGSFPLHLEARMESDQHECCQCDADATVVACGSPVTAAPQAVQPRKAQICTSSD